MTRTAKISYGFILATLILAASLNLAIALVTILFSYFALQKLNFAGNRWLAVFLFVFFAAGIFYGFGFFLRQAFVALPDIVATAVPIMIDFAKSHNVALPFSDLESLRALILETVMEQLRSFANLARIATKESIFILIGIVVAISLFVAGKVQLSEESRGVRNNLYQLTTDEIVRRFTTFYRSFTTVMGAQIIISGINAFLTAIFVTSISLPYSSVVIGLTFLCGLLPVIGNIISNTVIVGIAITISPKLALASLIFLVVLHKLEYFLNSKIIGSRIRNPMWLTLLGLIIGERLMGIPGMILAPVVLDYIRVEASAIPVPGAIAAMPSPEEKRLLEPVVVSDSK